MPLLGGGKVRESCSEAVAQFYKGSCHGDTHEDTLPSTPAPLLPLQVGLVPKLLLALRQGMGPSPSHAGLSALEEQQPPSPCWGPQTMSRAAPKFHQVPDPRPLPYFMWSPKAAELRGP